MIKQQCIGVEKTEKNDNWVAIQEKNKSDSENKEYKDKKEEPMLGLTPTVIAPLEPNESTNEDYDEDLQNSEDESKFCKKAFSSPRLKKQCGLESKNGMDSQESYYENQMKYKPNTSPILSHLSNNLSNQLEDNSAQHNNPSSWSQSIFIPSREYSESIQNGTNQFSQNSHPYQASYIRTASHEGHQRYCNSYNYTTSNFYNSFSCGSYPPSWYGNTYSHNHHPHHRSIQPHHTLIA